MFTNKRASRNLTLMPDNIDVVAIGLVLDQGAGRLGFECASRLVTLMPTNSDIVGLAKMFADVIDCFPMIRAHAAVVVLKRAAVPDHIEIVHVCFVPSEDATCRCAKGAVLTLKLARTLGDPLGRRQDRTRHIAVGKVFV